MSSYQNISTSIQASVLTLTINRPSKMNALNLETLAELKKVFDSVAVNPEIRGVIITGEGEKAFVAGADISELAGLDAQSAEELSKRGQNLFSFIENFSKPVIAAVNGFALGGGCELALACHIRIASENAKFGLPEVTLGILPGYGGTQRMTALVGKGKALELMLTGNMLSAMEAKECGLANHVVPLPELMHKVSELMQKIIAQAPLAIAEIISSANQAGTANGYAYEAKAFARCTHTEDFKEGTTAFLEKRKAVFKGK